ncbi:threonine dehydratase [Piscinibacter terrae]|uniref:Threonine dehydratase n=1 Tax=Piscinibacter terrae TaxID=2496871 RepID=A0A3N7HTD4_9BURK|nr:threonine dehydratase [Albitalea terrae]RQP24121.1 threonine dehydratase [Albitalea terrae]
MFQRDSLEQARTIVRATFAPTPQQMWPLLNQRLGANVWVKHENHTPVGAFKLRGGLVYFEGLRRREPDCKGVVTATRGNHGQSIGFAAARAGLSATIVVPRGNSVEKNAAMRALGVELIEHGDDFQASREHAQRLAGEQGWHMVPSFHPDLVRGVATYWIEFFEAVQPEVVFVPIGQGSGICACVAARAFTGARTRIVGVVSAHATAYLDSFRAGRVIESPVTTKLADGMACRLPDGEALEVILREVDDVVAVSDDEVAQAMRALFADTHNVAEGAGAASLAAASQQQSRWLGRKIGVVLTGANVDSAVFERVLGGQSN